MKTVCESFASRPQVGFVPKCVIGEVTHLLRLLQAYLDEIETEGLILALDWEKAFDRCSWDYLHLASEALNFGPHFIQNLTTMTNKYSPPMRKVKQNGIREKPFSILSGVPQGCPSLPLAFLVIAEGLTRLILESDIAGIPVGNTTHKLSRFSNVTQLLLKGYSEIPKVWPLLDQYERESGMCANAQKNVGIQCGSLKHTTVPPDLTPKGVIIHWVKPNNSTKILGFPFWMEGEEASFWESLYQIIKTKLALWHSHFMLTITCRAMLANFMIYSRPRYWIQTRVALKWFHQALKSDVRALL